MFPFNPNRILPSAPEMSLVNSYQSVSAGLSELESCVDEFVQYFGGVDEDAETDYSGVLYYFAIQLHDMFIQEQDAFTEILGAFYRAEYPNISRYVLPEILPSSAKDVTFILFHQRFFTNILLNACESGSVAARELLLNFIKIHFKEEYRYLKRIKELTPDGVLALSLLPSDGACTIFIARLMGIPLSRSTQGLVRYFVFEKDKSLERKKEKEQKKMSASDTADNECIDAVTDFITDNMDDIKKCARKYFRFCDRIFRGLDLAPFVDANAALFDRDVVRLLVSINQRLFFSAGESVDMLTLLLVFSFLCHSFGIFVKDSIGCFYTAIGLSEEGLPYISPYMTDDAGEDDRSDNVRNDGMEMQAAPKDGFSSSSPESASQSGDDIDEVSDLRHKLSLLKNQVSALQKDLDGAEKENAKLRDACSSYEKDLKELAALRSCVYKLTDEAGYSDDRADFDDICRFLKDVRIAIVGGNDNWIKKLRGIFPEWKFVRAQVSGAVNPDFVHGVRKLYFFTDTLAHSNYQRFLSVLRSSGTPFGYIHGVNIESNVMQIYHDLQED